MKTKSLLFLLTMGHFCLAQTANLQGIILNQNAQKVAFVNIQILELQNTTQSNDLGKFTFTGIAPGAYTLRASYIGYKTFEEKVILEAGKTLNLRLLLSENAESLREIVIQGTQTINEKPLNIGKIAIKPMDLPQSVVTFDHKTLAKQQVLRMADVLMNTNGVYISGTTGGYQEEISGRGFTFGSSNTFKNGVRYFNGMTTEMSSVERVEVLKGSTAILFGNVAAGGIINLISKKPKFDFGGELSLRLGSFDFIKPSLDIYGGIGKSQKAAFRLNTSYEKANSFRQGVSSERFYVNPSLLFTIGSKTDLYLEADYQEDDRTADFAVGIINYAFVNIPRERFLGVPWSYFKAKQISSTATLNNTINKNWSLSGIASVRTYATDLFSNTRPNRGVLIGADGTWVRNIERIKTAEPYYFGQIDIKGNFKTGQVSHTFLAGIDSDTYKTNTLVHNPLNKYDTVNVFGTKTYTLRTDIPTLTPLTETVLKVKRVGVYVQDLLGINTKLRVLLGLRYSYQDLQSDVVTLATKVNVQSNLYDGAFSPRLGLVYQPSTSHSLFASYANSFTLNTGTDFNGKALAPSLIDQYELGVKNELFDRKLSANLTIYRIYNSNLAQISLQNGNTNANIKELAGSVQSDGLELDLVAKPLAGLQLMAGYSYNEAKFVRSNTFIEGSFLKYNPNHTANVSANYSLSAGKLKGLNLGLMAMYMGERYAGRSTRVQVKDDDYRLVPLPAFTQTDATLAYQWKQLELKAKLGNVFDVLSYHVHDDNSVNPITPRNYSLSIGWKF